MRTDPFVDPLQFLTACHGRIRMRLCTFLQAATRLRAPGSIERHQLEAALLFFRSSGEGHNVDEEITLFPRLRPRLQAAGEDEAVALIDRLLAEHEEQNAAFERMERAMLAIDPSLGTGDGLPDPGAAPIACGTPAAVELAAALEAVVAEYEAHIPLEDDVIYPIAAQVMPADELAEVAKEMRERRRLGRKLLG